MKTLFALLFLPAGLVGQILTTNPERFTANEKVKITVDVSSIPNLASEEQLYIWAWTDVVPNKVSNGDWNNSSESYRVQKEREGIFSFTINPAEFYGVAPGDLKKIEFLLKTKTGNRQTSDLALLVGKTVAETKEILFPKQTAPKPIDFRSSLVKPLKVNSKELDFLPMEVKVGRAKITVDPRIELAYTIAIMAGYPFITPDNMQYKDDIVTRFSSYSDEPFVSEFKNNVISTSIDAIAFFMLNVDDNFEPMPSMSKSVVDKMGGIDKVQTFLNNMKAFCVKVKYGSFFNSQKRFYDLIINNYAFALKDYKDIDLIEDYYGIKQNSYSIVLNPLFSLGYFGVINMDYKGIQNVYAVIQPETVVNGIPVFPSTIGQYSLLFHEFSHSFVNPLVDQHIDEVAKYSYLYDPIAQSMKSQGYQEWIVTAKEHIVRSVTCRLGSIKYGEIIGKSHFENVEKNNHFIYADALINKLKFYEQNRIKYKDFESFFPELIDVFKNESPATVGQSLKEIESLKSDRQLSKIPKVGEAFNEECVIIRSTHEKTPEAQSTVDQTINQLNNLLPRKFEIITDDIALKTNLSNFNVLVFGTMDGNTYLQKHFSKIPIFIDNEKIMTDIESKGNDYQFVISWVNPDNEKKAMVVFGAQQASQIKDFVYSPFKDGYNFWVAKNLVTINAGFFKNIAGQWLPSK